MTGAFESASVTGLVPIFPLAGMCLLPGETLPLYVFEPRYRALLRDALGGDRLIAMAALQPGYEAMYFGNPPIHPCMGVGRIVAHQLRADGSSDIVLLGVARVRLAKVVREMPYRIGRAVDLDECVGDETRLARVLEEIGALLRGIIHAPGEPGLIPLLLGDPGRLAGRLAGLTRIPFEDKQAILETDLQPERHERLLRWLRSLVKREWLDNLLRSPADPPDHNN